MLWLLSFSQIYGTEFSVAHRGGFVEALCTGHAFCFWAASIATRELITKPWVKMASGNQDTWGKTT